MKLHNTATKKIEEFSHAKDEPVSIYTCGPTVYDQLHVGNWVSYIRWDTLVRLLKHHGYDVTRVLNITDVGHLVRYVHEGEDKLEKGARCEGATAWDVARKYTEDFQDGMEKLHLLRPSYMP